MKAIGWRTGALVSVMVLAGCTKGTPAATSTTEPPSSPTITSPLTPPPSAGQSQSPASPSPSDSEAVVLEDGRHFGFIKSVDLQAGTLSFDLAYFYTGDEAIQAAIEDGLIQPGEELDNDSYIRNNNPKLRTLSLAAQPEIVIVNWPKCCETAQGDLQSFADAFTQATDLYRGPGSPYWLTVQSGRVVKIEEQYIP